MVLSDDVDRTERFYRIEKLLRERKLVSLAAFVETLEVSRATVKRDLQYLRDRFQWDIPWDPQARGYRLAEEYRQLPVPLFSATEIQAMLLLEQLLAEIQPGILGRSLESLGARLRKLLEENEQCGEGEVRRRLRIIQPAARPGESKHFQTISSATLSRKRLRIVHRNRASGAVRERRVSPQRLTLYKGTWYLEAWCHESKGIRRFALDAFLDAHVEEAACREVEMEELDAALGAGYGIFAGVANSVAILRFFPRIAPWVEQERWHPNQSSEYDGGGHLVVRIPYSEDTELIMDILRYGPDVEVVAPRELRIKLFERLRETISIYQER